MALTKKYKPGQLVTIDNRVYRVYRTERKYPCANCDAYILCKYKGWEFKLGCNNAIGIECYFKLVKS